MMAGVVQELLIICIFMTYFERSHKTIFTCANAHCTSYTSDEGRKTKKRDTFSVRGWRSVTHLGIFYRWTEIPLL